MCLHIYRGAFKSPGDMKKVVFELNLPDNKAKQKAMKAVSALPGIDSITVDMKSKTLTIIGVADPVKVVTKLRKCWPTEIISVGPGKDPDPDPDQKKEEPKKEEPKKEEPKQEEPKKEEPKKKKEKEKPKKDEEKKNESTQNEQRAEVAKAYKAHNPEMIYYYAHSTKENPPNYFC